MPHHRLQNSLSELQSPPWFRSADLGFGCSAGSDSNSGCLESLCSNLWSGILNCPRIWSIYFELGSKWRWCSVLVRVASSLNFIGSWILMMPDAVPSAFWGMIQTSEIKGE